MIYCVPGPPSWEWPEIRLLSYIYYNIQEIAERVNTGDLPSNGSQPAPVPLSQVYEFAMAAVAAQRTRSATPTTLAVTTRNKGARELATYFSVVIVSIVTAALNVQAV